MITYTADTGIAGIKARELTVGDIRNLLKGIEDKEFDLVGESLFDWVTFDELVAMTDATREDLDQLRPSDLSKLAEKCKEVNADFFSWRARVMTPTPVKSA